MNDLIKLAYTSSTIITGDFNLDFGKQHYARKSLFDDFENKLGDFKSPERDFQIDWNICHGRFDFVCEGLFVSH